MLKTGSLFSREVLVKRKRRSRAEWIRICEAHDASGETTAAFARRHRLNPGTLGWWRSKLHREGAVSRQSATFVEVVTDSPEQRLRAVVRVGAVAIEFIEGAPPASWVAELAAEC